jgi:hypothetical protein
MWSLGRSCGHVGPKLGPLPSGSKLQPCSLDDVGPICATRKLPVPCAPCSVRKCYPQLALAPLLNYHASALLVRADLMWRDSGIGRQVHTLVLVEHGGTEQLGQASHVIKCPHLKRKTANTLFSLSSKS